MKIFSDNWRTSPHLDQVKLVYQTTSDMASKPILCCSNDVYSYLMTIWDKDTIELHEEFWILLFNNQLRCLGWHKLSSGGKNSTIVDISHVLVLAVLANAESVAIAHNHPSGKLQPSRSDIQLTKKIASTLKNAGIRLNDHLIITSDSFYSFRDAGMLTNIPDHE